MWSRARRRLPVSSRLSVDTSMWAASATCCNVMPLAVRSSRMRRRTRASTSSVVCLHGKTGCHIAPTASMLGAWNTIWDCIVVGGGAAGLSAALVLGRARRRTLVVDAGRPSNAPAHGIGGLLGHDGRPPAELYAAGRAELAAYPTVEVVDGRGRRRAPARGRLRARPGRRHASTSPARVVLATGHGLPLPGGAGPRRALGPSVFHCPFCHGWEVRDGASACSTAAPTASTARCSCGPGATTSRC